MPRKYSSGTVNQYKGLIGPSSGQWSVLTQKTNFDNNVVFEFRGILKAYLANYPRGQETRGLDWFLKQLANKNIMIFYDNLTTGSKRKVGGSAVSSKIAQLLDAKIDDGRPTTGRLMGLKGSAAYNITDPNLSAEYCYDKAGNDIGKAIYNNANDTKYGCDLIYVMEDVK